jgi:hypothetical protein
LKQRDFFNGNKDLKDQYVFTYAYDDKGDAKYPKGWVVDCPGGKRHLNETSLQCGIREARNETVVAFSIEDDKLANKIEVIHSSSDHTLEMFVAKVVTLIPPPPSSNQKKPAAAAAATAAAASASSLEVKTTKPTISKLDWAESDSESEEEAAQQQQEKKKNVSTDDEDDEDDEEEDEEDEEEEEEETVDQSEAVDAQKTKPAVVNTKSLSKKEKKALKEKELEELDALLNEMGVEAKQPSIDETTTAQASTDPTNSVSDDVSGKNKKKNKNNKNNKKAKGSKTGTATAAGAGESDVPTGESGGGDEGGGGDAILSAAEVMKAKAKKSKERTSGSASSEAVKLAAIEAKTRAEADAKKKKKKSKDKNAFNVPR